MSRLSLVSILTCALGLGACGGAPATPGEDEASAHASAPAGVMLVGILGDEHCESTSFTPAVLAEGLRLAAPDALVIPISMAVLEQALECDDPLCVQSLRVANDVNACWFWDGVLPWLRQSSSVDVVTFEDITLEEEADLAAWIAATGGEPAARSYFRAQATFMMAELQASGGYESPGWLQSDLYATLTEDVDRWLSYYAEEAMGAGGQLRVLDLMTERLLAALQGTDPTDRTVVLLPARSRWYVERVLGAAPEWSRLPAAEIFPYVAPSP